MSNYTIVVSNLPIKDPLLNITVANHRVIAMLDSEGKVVKELNGLAAGADGVPKPIGYLPSDKLIVQEDIGRAYYDASQTKATVYSGTLAHAESLWALAKACGTEINEKNIKYPFFGLFGGQDGANSNSVSTTLLKCMNIPEPNLPGWAPRKDIILLTPSEINEVRTGQGFGGLSDMDLKKDSAFLNASSNDYYGLNFDVTGYSSLGLEQWDLDGQLRNEGFFVANYSGDGLTLHIDNSYLDIEEYSDLKIEGVGNDIEFLDHVAIDVEGDYNWIDTKDYYTVSVTGEANSINLWGLNGSVYANGWRVPYAPQDSIYDTAENIIDGFYFLLYGGDNKNPRSPVWPDPTNLRKEGEKVPYMVRAEHDEHVMVVGVPDLV